MIWVSYELVTYYAVFISLEISDGAPRGRRCLLIDATFLRTIELSVPSQPNFETPSSLLIAICFIFPRKELLWSVNPTITLLSPIQPI